MIQSMKYTPQIFIFPMESNTRVYIFMMCSSLSLSLTHAHTHMYSLLASIMGR